MVLVLIADGQANVSTERTVMEAAEAIRRNVIQVTSRLEDSQPAGQ
jgi:Mg-chelatase subunit ChlD